MFVVVGFSFPFSTFPLRPRIGNSTALYCCQSKFCLSAAPRSGCAWAEISATSHCTPIEPSRKCQMFFCSFTILVTSWSVMPGFATPAKTDPPAKRRLLCITVATSQTVLRCCGCLHEPVIIFLHIAVVLLLSDSSILAFCLSHNFVAFF